MSFALVFSGQGTQHPAMLPWLQGDPIARALCARLRIHDWRAAVSDTAWSERNAHAQALLTGLALSAWHQLAGELPEPAAVAGYSVGELAAFSAAGLYDAETALDLSLQRAASMDRSAARTPGGLLAATMSSCQVVDDVCRLTGLVVAIRNGEGAFVLGGPESSLHLGERALASQGARCTRLRVAVASHTPWMAEAAEEFRRILSSTDFGRPRTALFSNVADRVRDADGARRALADQIATTVGWDDCMENLRARNVTCVLEVGPGSALARMWNERYPDVPARSCDEFGSAGGIVKWVCRLAR